MPVKPRKACQVRQAKFLAAFAEVGNLVTAAKLTGEQRQSHYNWMNSDPTYPERYANAKAEAIEHLEAEARRRAVEGVVEPVFGSGGKNAGTKKIGEVRKYSDTLLIFLLKGAAPDKYRDRLDHRHSGENGGPIQTSVTIQQVMDLLDSRDSE